MYNFFTEENIVEKELKNYIQKEIKEKYKTFDKGHNVSHFNYVTKNCIQYGKEMIKQGYGVDLDIAYIVGAFHDIGLLQGREDHAKKSAMYVKNDIMLKKYFDEQTINLIADAVEDHSSHLDYEPRNIYGKIVADADRNNTIYLTFSRPIKYGLEHERQLDRQGHIDRVFNFVKDKFGRNGYVKYWLNIPDTTKQQKALFELLDDEKLCKQYIAGLFDEITKGKML